jgi:transcriptional regulator
MYIPPHFREDRADVLHQMMEQHNFATLVTLGADGLIANHIPMLLDRTAGPFGTLRGHVSKANPQWQDSLPDVEALAIFQGPAAYISPSWYPSKEETGRVVPTYNYIVVHAHGLMRTFQDPAQLHEHVRAMTNRQESAFAQPWRIEDAPPEFIKGMLKGIVGIEIPIARLEGKWKVSQNRTAAERAGAVKELQASDDPDYKAMADLISEAGGLD